MMGSVFLYFGVSYLWLKETIEMINQQLLQFLSESVTAFHAVGSVRRELTENGYEELCEGEKWTLQKGKKYFTVRNESSLIAFRIPEGEVNGFMAGAAHTDSPSFRIKPQPEMKGNGCIRLNTEGYGGMLCGPWFDRPLSVAGRLIIKTENGIRTQLYKSERDLLLIPSLAIHMNRGVNENTSYNKQVDMMPLFAEESDEHCTLMDVISEETGIAKEDMIASDLMLYNREEPRIWGARNEFLSSGHLDDLQCVFGLMKGFLAASESLSIPVLALFDNEEVGSLTKQGAYSTFFYDVLRRIALCLDKDEEEFRMMLADSFLVSADNAHAIHPNHPEKADPILHPAMNKGIVLKYSANQKYTSDAVSASIFRLVCKEADVPLQEFTNRSDLAGGSTLGNLSNSQVSMNAVDIGLPQLAMHSCYETAGVKDTEYLVKAMKVYYSHALKEEGKGAYNLI